MPDHSGRNDDAGLDPRIQTHELIVSRLAEYLKNMVDEPWYDRVPEQVYYALFLVMPLVMTRSGQ